MCGEGKRWGLVAAPALGAFAYTVAIAIDPQMCSFRPPQIGGGPLCFSVSEGGPPFFFGSGEKGGGPPLFSRFQKGGAPTLFVFLEKWGAPPLSWPLHPK